MDSNNGNSSGENGSSSSYRAPDRARKPETRRMRSMQEILAVSPIVALPAVQVPRFGMPPFPAPLHANAVREGLHARRFTVVEDGEQCCICMVEMKKGANVVQLDCAHHYHFNCINQWFKEKNSCPVCKRVGLPYA